MARIVRGGVAAWVRIVRSGVAAVGAAVLACGLSVPPALADGVPAAGEPAPYAFAEDARTVKGSSTTSDAPRLAAGTVHRDALPRDGELVYRVDLDAVSHAYVSVVAVPPPGAELSFQDGLKVSLQDRDGSVCGTATTRFGSAEFARPIAAYADRTLGPGRSLCQEAGPYYAVVERDGRETSSGEPWELELRYVLEPRLKESGPTAAPGKWPSASPEPPADGPRERAGGSGFFDAPGLTEGEWTDRVEPGESRFYRVPVDWGQQLFVSADLGSSAGDGFVGSALPVSLYNPALGLVDSEDSLSYDGRQKSTALDPLPPVAYENRFSSDTRISGLRFAGWYYLRVSLHPEVGEEFGQKPYGLTLRVNVEGEAGAAPPYAGPAGIFTVTGDDRRAAADGESGPRTGDTGTMRLVAAGGFGTGTVLLLALGGWAVLARRRADTAPAAGSAGPPGGPALPSPDVPTRHGPPRGR
ncbi:hypothetical protein RND61_07535 [Streptomyces sp. TRM76323]|uniref:Aromatic ring-opening dioxygenase LigA n=1 Tax=Streptomyces tamarix TaxID=3078565 RepID=A0ABU3QGY2_9ACTN|nr:hypothetical protein [Streptomyces tamarix]MDT9681926.1 hypothetical protein [Streptomyces tamarix]